MYVYFFSVHFWCATVAQREASQRLAALQRDTFKATDLYDAFTDDVDDNAGSSKKRKRKDSHRPVYDSDDETADNHDDGDAESDDESDDLPVDPKAPNRRRRRRDGKSRRASNALAPGAPGKTRRHCIVKSLQHALDEEATEAMPSHVPTYLSAAAAPSRLPQRRFCTTCGYFAGYTCQRCLARYCSQACLATHQETKRCR